MKLTATVQAIYRDKLKEPFDPLYQREAERILQQAKQHVDGPTLRATWAEGEKMTMEEALDLALKVVEEM